MAAFPYCPAPEKLDLVQGNKRIHDPQLARFYGHFYGQLGAASNRNKQKQDGKVKNEAQTATVAEDTHPVQQRN